jgi:hypothetical protein
MVPKGLENSSEKSFTCPNSEVEIVDQITSAITANHLKGEVERRVVSVWVRTVLTCARELDGFPSIRVVGIAVERIPSVPLQLVAEHSGID